MNIRIYTLPPVVPLKPVWILVGYVTDATELPWRQCLPERKPLPRALSCSSRSASPADSWRGGLLQGRLPGLGRTAGLWQA